MRLPKVALVHEWFSIVAGSEKVVGELLSLFPEADLFSLVDFFNDEQRKLIHGKKATTSMIQSFPFARGAFRSYLPFMPLAIEQFDFSKYDIVLSSHHAVAKGILTNQNQLHICYCHTPMRYAWDVYHQYIRETNLSKGLKGVLAKTVLHYLRLWDLASVQRVDEFIANSNYIARRIKKIYNREATVIYPPVDINGFECQPKKDDYFIAIARFVPYKKIDVIIEAFAKMPNKKLVVIGEGDMTMVKRATQNVTVMNFQPFEKLKGYLQSAKALVYAAEEDFGITMVESQACGTPVIAFGKGGASETVIHEKTGILFEHQTPQSIIKAVEHFEVRSFDPELVRKQAEQFDRLVFLEKMKHFIDEKYQAFLEN